VNGEQLRPTSGRFLRRPNFYDEGDRGSTHLLNEPEPLFDWEGASQPVDFDGHIFGEG
jgi:hypothetical protein